MLTAPSVQGINPNNYWNWKKKKYWN